MKTDAFHSKRQRVRSEQGGFTLVEFMVASVIFASFLVLTTAFVLLISRSYYKGIVVSKTQETARAIVNDVTRAIQTSRDISLESGTGPHNFCAGARRYVYLRGQKVVDASANHALMVDSSPCVANPSFPAVSASAQELIPENMRLSQFTVVSVGADAYEVTVRVAYGDDDLLDNPGDPTASCRTTVESRFCAVSELKTIVTRRL